ncbi:hypothetical protein EC968_002168 [Mortierella alpina]|nr:hypothetical protein EC968_002168 [Mortierella alpina]
MDTTGSSAGEWQATSKLFTNRTIDSTGGQYQVSLASCGPLARNGAIRLVAESLQSDLWDEKTCYFSIFQTFSLVPDPPVDPPPSQQPIAPEKPTATSNPPEEATRAPRIGQPTANPTTLNPKIPGATTVPNPGPDGNTLPTNNPNASPVSPGSQPTPNPSQSGPGPGGVFGDPQASQPTNGGGGGAGGPAPSSPPPAQLPNGSGAGANEDAEQKEKIKTITAALSSVGTAACLALVVLSLLVIRKRRKESRMISGSGHKTLPRSMAPGARTRLGGGAGGAMKESKMRFALKRSPKEGYFYQMDDNNTDIDIDSHSGEAFDEKSGNRSGIDTMLATTSQPTRITSMVEDGAGVHERSVMTSVPPLRPLQDAHLEPLPPGFDRQRRRSSLPLTDPTSSAFSMSSYRSSFETSSVIRKYWAASMAARAERRAEGHPSSTRDLEDGRSDYEEGSIFGDGSRDSESRLADIMSMRTTGSGHSAATARRPYRRNTLNSFSAYSFGQTETTTMSLSSIPDSLMISEDEFLERLRAHELELEKQYHQARQPHGEQYSDEGDEDEAYYSRTPYHHHHPHPYYHHGHGHGSVISRRTSSVPSLTPSTDPFKTFDSNEVLMDVDHTTTTEDIDPDPFSDDRALSRTSSSLQSGHHVYRHHPHHHHDAYGYPLYITQAQQEIGDGQKARSPMVQPLPAYPPPSALPY